MGLLKLLQDKFGHQDFKSQEQKDAVETLVREQVDIFVCMPTGSGKSIIYQLAAVSSVGKVAIVVCPILALIKDQCDSLAAKGINAASLNSKMTRTERVKVEKDLRLKFPVTQLLYITPEQCQTTAFKELLQSMMANSSVSYLVVDEAHCVAEWGRDFRPDYLKLGDLSDITRNTPWVALTATATKEMATEIASILRLQASFKSFRLSSLRNNLNYDVEFKNSKNVSILLHQTKQT